MTRNINFNKCDNESNIITDITFETPYPDIEEKDNDLFGKIYNKTESYKKCTEAVEKIQAYCDPKSVNKVITEKITISSIFESIKDEDDIMSDILSFMFNRLIAEEQKIIGEINVICSPVSNDTEDCDKEVDVECTAEENPENF